MVHGAVSKMLKPSSGYPYLTCEQRADINTYAYSTLDAALATPQICMLTHVKS